MVCAESKLAPNRLVIPVRDYDLSETLSSGQAFRWRIVNAAWEGVVQGRWVRLNHSECELVAETAIPHSDWQWLTDYLQTEVVLGEVAATFPADEPMRAAMKACPGLRLLRQDPWECLASFILSSTKQIVQIQQIVALLCERYGERVETAVSGTQAHAFPTMERVAACTEAELRACKMGFRAPYLLQTACMLVAGQIDLSSLADKSSAEARDELMKFPGVGRKIADCVLLFAYGFQDAFPVDVWVQKALQNLYFPRRRVSAKRLRHFSATHFGPNAGYAQQYLFHYVRTKADLNQLPHVKPRKNV